MNVWIVTTHIKETDDIDEVSEPYISAECAMKDWPFRHLEWKHIETPKFGGTVLEHWQAEDNSFDYVLESQHVNGSE